MAYEVTSDRAVERKLDELGIDSVRDIRRAGGAHHRDVPAVVQAEQLHLRAQATPGSMAAVTEELLAIRKHIAAVRDELHEVLGEVRTLGGRQFDGWGPIAKRMAVCLSDRVGADAGAEHALSGYLTELAELDAILTQTAALYVAAESDAVARIGRAGADG